MPRHAAPSRSRRQRSRSRFAWILAGAFAVLLVGGLVSGLIIGHKLASSSATSSSQPPTSSASLQPVSSPVAPATSPTTTTANSLQGEFAEFAQTVDAKLGVALLAVGSSGTPETLGDWTLGPAWSSIKVPLAIASLREQNSQQVTDEMTRAITESDNAAAEAIWAGLGEPTIAKGKVEAILQQYGDPTSVQSQRVRPEFTAFGQTQWSLVNQAHFMAGAVCDSRNQPIFNLMGQIEAGQSWGLGNISNTEFKGGWGPSTSGAYLVRQIGVITTSSGKRIAVAIAAEPTSGSFDAGTADLTKIANWLSQRLDQLPAGEC